MTIGVSLAYVSLSSIYSSVSSLLSHSWSQVTVALSLVAFTSAVFQVLQLNVGASVAIAALRYMAQLIVVTFGPAVRLCRGEYVDSRKAST